MSHRPIATKRANRLSKLILQEPLLGHIDLVQYLQDHGYADTAGKAREMLEDGRVMADSHPLGMKGIYEAGHMDGNKGLPTTRLAGRPSAPAGLRDRIRVKVLNV